MSAKWPELIIDPKDFPVFLRARMMQDSVAGYAAKLGISANLLYLLLTGKRKPSAAILRKVDLEVVYRARPAAMERVKK
jgi:hypothetical protein